MVAEHFADNTRADLFLELLNEPELSAGGTAPTQTQWTGLAEEMVAAIRAHDTRHTIIFGDVEWYGITPLSRREPLSDDNVIYSFHFYEPFIFTHQGASWANMGSTHDVPFPYSPDRWSDRSADLGFTPFMESWLLNQARDYYKLGNAEDMRNRIVVAKQWAVDHNVPVICNEFGAYDATARLEDRVNYYAALTGIFREFEIPWQHWFMIVGEDGTVIPEYREAFGLD
jgi:licheninase